MASEPAELEPKIVKQVEYYFGDSNLPRDRFLLEQIKLDDGWVPIETMLKFNRLSQLSDDIKVIAEALNTSELMQVSEDKTKIRRSPDKPLPENTEERRQEITARTVYAKEFPLDVTVDTLHEFFDRHGGVETVFMRKNENKEFKGSIFATFKNLDDAKKFVEAEKVKFTDEFLEYRKFKSQYYVDKQQLKKKAQQYKEVRKEMAIKRQQDDEEKKVENEVTPGALLHLKGFNPITSREDIKNLLQCYGNIAWVDFNRGDKEGWIRYDSQGKASEVLEKVLKDKDNTIKLNGHVLEARVLEGEEEVEVWKKVTSGMKKRSFGGKRHGGKKIRTGKRPCKNKRQVIKEVLERDRLGLPDDAGDSGTDYDDHEEPPSKMAKVEAKEEVKADS